MSGWSDGDDGEDVGESLAILLVVSELHLYFILRSDSLVKAVLGDLVCPGNGAGRWILAAWCLEEATVAAQDLALRVACELAEGIAGVDNWTVRHLEVAEDQGDRAVHRAELDLGVRTADDLKQNRHHVEASGRVETGVDDRVLHLSPFAFAGDTAIGILGALFGKLILQGVGFPRVQGRRCAGSHCSEFTPDRVNDRS